MWIKQAKGIELNKKKQIQKYEQKQNEVNKKYGEKYHSAIDIASANQTTDCNETTLLKFYVNFIDQKCVKTKTNVLVVRAWHRTNPMVLLPTTCQFCKMSFFLIVKMRLWFLLGEMDVFRRPTI